MERAEGLLGGKFLFKRQNDGTIDKTKVVCSICQAECSYHRSSSSLSYHLNAKHPTESSPRLDGRQPTLHDFSRKITRPVREKVTNAVAVWGCRWLSAHQHSWRRWADWGDSNCFRGQFLQLTVEGHHCVLHTFLVWRRESTKKFSSSRKLPALKLEWIQQQGGGGQVGHCLLISWC